MHQLGTTRPLHQVDFPLYSLRNLGYRYPDGTPALAGIDLDISCGDRLALVGQSGAGKTTLARLLNGLLKPDQGQLTYRGQLLAGANLMQARRKVGLLFQDPDDQLFCNSIGEDVLFGPRNLGLGPAEAKAAAEAALAAVDLTDEADRPPHTLSYGQRKRAALATLLAMRPEVLILDEPTANLDPRQEQLLLDRLQAYSGTLICITHNLLFAAELCTRAVVLAKGKVHHDYSLRELIIHRSSLREHGLDCSFRFAGEPPLLERVRPEASRENRQPPLLTMTNYSYHYPNGRQVLQDLTFVIRRGDRLALVGENGAGKSTLASCLAGLRLGRGQFTLNDRPINSRTRRDLTLQTGLVFQNCADQLFCPSCYEEVAFGPRQLGWSPTAIKEAVADALQQVCLDDFAGRVPLHLSGGERKRLALAAVLAMQPQILILDEPTAGLDPRGEELLLDILRKLSVTLLLISHDLHFIRSLTERTLVLHEGRLVQDYATADFFADTDLSSLNRLDYSYRGQRALKSRNASANRSS